MSSLAIIITSTIGIIAIAGLGLVSYYQEPSLLSRFGAASPSPFVVSHAPTITPPAASPVASPIFSPTFYPIPGSSQVQGSSTRQPISAPKTTPTSAVSLPSPSAESSSFAITFIDTPSSVRTGESFEVHWQVTGPAGAAGQGTELKLTYNKSSQSGNSNSSISSNNSTSFGSFTIPKVFSSTFSFGNEPGELHLTATADVGGQTLTANKTVELTN